MRAQQPHRGIAAAAMDQGASIAGLGLPPLARPGSSKAASRSKPKAQSKKGLGGGAKRGAAEEIEIKPELSALVRLRYEGRRPDPTDEPHIVQLSKVHKSARLVLSQDRLSVTGHKGFRSVRSSHGAHVGTWYCEARVKHLGSSGHVRLGWGTKRAELNAPMGFDAYGFCYRDLEGSKVLNGCRNAYGQAYGEGDVIGLLIHLPSGGRSLESQHNEYTKWKGKWMRIEDPEPEPEVLAGSFALFTRNGESQGVAYRDLLEGTYYPAASLYTLPEQELGAAVTFNFGPHFAHAPPMVEGVHAPVRALCELSLPNHAAVVAIAGAAAAVLAEAQAPAAMLVATAEGAGVPTALELGAA